MSFAPTQEQEQLRSVARSFLAERSPETEVRRLMETDAGYDPQVWQQMAQQLGLQGLPIAEEHGGLGFTYQEVGLVLEEMGAALLCAPYFSTVVLGVSTIQHAGDSVAAAALLPKVAAGELRLALAHLEGKGRWDAPIETVAARSGSQWLLTGEKRFVLDGHTADVLLVTARTDAGVSLFVVDRTEDGIERELLTTLDSTRKQARITFTGCAATLLGTDGAATRVLGTVLDIASASLAMEQVGVTARALAMAVDYAKVRVQFGEPIGSFQAIKHKCADMLVRVESARSAASYASWATAHAPEELPAAASLANAFCSEAAFQVAADNVHVHGGIGYTWEHPAHLYFKRAKSAQLMFGTPGFHRERIAHHLGL